MIRDKFPDAITLLSHARQAEGKAEQAKRFVSAARTALNEASLREEFTSEEAEHFRSLIARLIEHNEGKPIADGMTVWIGHVQGCNVVQTLDANTPEMLELPEDMRDGEPEPVEAPNIGGLKVGDRVRMLMGTLKGRLGDVERLDINDGTLRVLFDGFAYGLWCKPSWLEPAPEA